MNSLSFMPTEASLQARHTDVLFIALVAVSAVIVVLVSTLVLVFAIRYRKGSRAKRGDLPEVLSREFEIGWTAATLFLFLFIFWWMGASQLQVLRPPDNATEIHVVAKQWMWKVEHPDGVREIDALHVPVGQPIRLEMTSQDVIHSFYVPELRLKQDVLPGRYTREWFTVATPGTYHLFCAEYCGTDHSVMLGQVVAMRADAYGRWKASQPQPGDLAAQGSALFSQLGCSACHGVQAAAGSAPDLHGLYESRVALADGRTVLADETWLRKAIVAPDQARPSGYPPLMPSYAKAVDEEGLVALIAYVKSLSTRPGAGA